MQRSGSERTVSLWIDTRPGRAFPAASGDLQVDVAVVGGGITGITAALLLKRAGKKVAVIEAHTIAGENTGLTTAHLATELDMRWHKLIDRFGHDRAALIAEAHRQAIARIERFVEAEKIDCALKRVPGYLYSESDRREDLEELEKELEAANELGFSARLTREVPLPFPAPVALRIENQGRFHPREYLLPLADLIPGDGSFVFERTRATEIEDGEPCHVVTDSGVITADEVIVAAHVPVSNRVVLHTKLAAYRTYVLAFPNKPGIEDALFWDNQDPYHYLRIAESPAGPLLIAGGEDHKVGQEEDERFSFARLANWAREHFGTLDVSHCWSGQIIETIDGLPYIGQNPRSDHLWVATGYSGNGITNGTIAAEILSELILKRQHQAGELFSPRRFRPISAVKRFISENVDYPAHLVGDRFKKPDAHTFMEVQHGEGKIVDHDGKKLAVYRDLRGELSVMSAVCTHLGCIVHWNTVEKSWDCPCHGSRFDATGEVLAGPAVRALEPQIDTTELTPTSPDVEETTLPGRRWKLVAE